MGEICYGNRPVVDIANQATLYHLVKHCEINVQRPKQLQKQQERLGDTNTRVRRQVFGQKE